MRLMLWPKRVQTGRKFSIYKIQADDKQSGLSARHGFSGWMSRIEIPRTSGSDSCVHSTALHSVTKETQQNEMNWLQTKIFLNETIT